MLRLALAAALPFAAALPQQLQHNVIMVLTDDQDILLGSMDPNGPMQKTRKLVVDKGAYFTNGFATTPICCPSRAEITSGRYMHNTRVYGNDCGGMEWVNGPEKLNMATYLSNAGYTTFYAGKYLNNYGSAKVGGCAHVPPGWDQCGQQRAFCRPFLPPHTKSISDKAARVVPPFVARRWYGLVGNSKYYGYTVCTGNNGSEVHGQDYATDYFTDRIANRTLEFLANVTAHKSPFFAMTGTPASHGPNDPAPQYSETYANMKSPRLPSWNVAPNPDKHYLLRHVLPMDEQHANVSDVFFQRYAHFDRFYLSDRAWQLNRIETGTGAGQCCGPLTIWSSDSSRS
jgi:arylsulfatase A-like enzyme